MRVEEIRNKKIEHTKELLFLFLGWGPALKEVVLDLTLVLIHTYVCVFNSLQLHIL